MPALRQTKTAKPEEAIVANPVFAEPAPAPVLPTVAKPVFNVDDVTEAVRQIVFTADAFVRQLERLGDQAVRQRDHAGHAKFARIAQVLSDMRHQLGSAIAQLS